MNGDVKLLKNSVPFDELYTHYHKKFVRFAFNYTRDLSVSEDFTNEAFIYYWENKSRLPDDTNIPAYVLTSIKNRCLSHLRHIELRENINNKILSDAQWELFTRISRLEACEPREIFTKEIQQIVDQTLRSFPEQTRLIFSLSRFEQLSHKEIAQQLNISTKSVEFHITKCIKKLRLELKDYYPLIFLIL